MKFSSHMSEQYDKASMLFFVYFSAEYLEYFDTPLDKKQIFTFFNYPLRSNNLNKSSKMELT